MSRWGLASSVRCRNVPAGPLKVPMWILSSSWRRSGQVRPAVFSAMWEEEGEPAEDDVGADPVLAPMPDGAQVDDLLHVAPAALDSQQLLLPGSDVLGGQFRVHGP